MPRNPDVPCAGGCGRLCWRSRTCRAPGEQMCRDCRAATFVPKPADARCAYCAKPFRSVRRSNGERTKACSKVCAGHLNAVAVGKHGTGRDPEKRRASYRIKNHRRRQARRVGFDTVTAEIELELRRKAGRCPMPGCGVALTDRPYLPNSKELDRKVPGHVGGTYTTGNVRIICRGCNVRRPRDGSDYAGPVTLWAQVD